MTPEDLAFEAGWQARDARSFTKPYGDLKEADAMLTSDYAAYKRETAEPLRCVDCQTMIMQGAKCDLCRKTEYRSYGSE